MQFHLPDYLLPVTWVKPFPSELKWLVFRRPSVDSFDNNRRTKNGENTVWEKTVTLIAGTSKI